MELRQLMHFLHVCRNKSFKRAAESLFISQQGLSSSIKRLEDELGAKLIERRPSGPVLLEDGVYLKNQVEKIAAVLEECEAHFERRQAAAIQTTVACAGQVISSYPAFFAPLLTEGAGAFRCRLVDCTAAEGERLLLSGEAALGILPAPLDEEKFTPIRKLFETPYVAVVSRGHPLEAEGRISVPLLRSYPLLSCLSDTAFHASLYEACLAAGFEPNFALQVREESGLFRMVQAIPAGVGFCTARIAEQLMPGGLTALPMQRAEWAVQAGYLAEVRDNRRSVGMQHFISEAQRFFEVSSEAGPPAEPRWRRLVSGLDRSL